MRIVEYIHDAAYTMIIGKDFPELNSISGDYIYIYLFFLAAKQKWLLLLSPKIFYRIFIEWFTAMEFIDSFQF